MASPPNDPHPHLAALDESGGDGSSPYAQLFYSLGKPEGAESDHVLVRVQRHQDHLLEFEGEEGPLHDTQDSYRMLYFIAVLGWLSPMKETFMEWIRSVQEPRDNTATVGAPEGLNYTRTVNGWEVKHGASGLTVSLPNASVSRREIIYAVYYALYSGEGIVVLDLSGVELAFTTNVDNDVPADYAKRLMDGGPLLIRELCITSDPVQVSVITEEKEDDSKVAWALLLSMLE